MSPSLHPPKSLPTRKPAPVLEFGGVGGFGSISPYFLYISLVKATYRKSLQATIASTIGRGFSDVVSIWHCQ